MLQTKRSRLSTALILTTILMAPSSMARTLDVSMADVIGPRNMAWQDCVGAGHAGLLLRPANVAQLRLVHDEIGFHSIRFHGIFADDTDVYRVANGKTVFRFDKVDAIYAAILKSGMRPFVEVSFMPRALARGSKTIFYWNANGSPPIDYGKWEHLITAFVRHLETRFGRAEVENWRFEVWNEPNMDGFWTDGNQAEYFHLYDLTVQSIKSVDSALNVGGPATAGAAWVPDFLRHAKDVGSPVDFVTTHTYGVQGGFFDEKGQSDNKLDPRPGAVVDDVLSVRQQIQNSTAPNLPLYVTEWSTSYNPRDPIHDDYLSASYILEKLKNVDGVAQSMSYWTYTDLFEEAGPPPTPFHGGFGLVSRDGIRKASFFAYKYLHELGPQLLRGADAHAWLTRDGRNFGGLVWDYTPPDMAESDRPYFRKQHPPRPLAPVALNVTGLVPGSYHLTVKRTGFQSNDAYSQYIAWGRPNDVTPDQVAVLQHLSDDHPEISKDVVIGPDGDFHLDVPFRTNDVVLVKLTAM